VNWNEGSGIGDTGGGTDEVGDVVARPLVTCEKWRLSRTYYWYNSGTSRGHI